MEGSSEFRSHPINDEELQGCVVMTCTLLELVDQVRQLKEILVTQRHFIEAQTHILKAFSDLFCELTDKSAERQFLDKSIQRAEREAARLRLPLWFWRVEPEKELRDMLLERARFLLGDVKTGVDDTWDLLCEFSRDYVQKPVSEELLTEIMEAAAHCEEAL